ncbi:hypothetical protein CIW56_04965 [Enterobacter roggenkampii]|nr:hypothetical protein CIW56_04965 [Enterobacter roggenkampii]
MSIRFMQLEQLSVPFQSMRDTLKAYRDELVRMAKLAFLNLMMNSTVQNRIVETDNRSANMQTAPEALQDVQTVEPMQEATQHAKVLVATVQRELDTSAGHSLEKVKEEYFAANTEWSAKTIKDYNACIDRFIVWASTIAFYP